jgi:precorrin-6Y C5,15-methyltransferase (decarboxylating)
MSAWLTIIGVGDDGIAGLAPPARAALDEAEIVVGSKRLLEQSDLPGKDCHAWASPMHSTIDRMAAWKPRSVAVLATGDPMHFGIGCTLARRFSTDEMRVLPAPSAFSLAAARLGWPLQEVECISLHGRSVALLEAALAPGVRILALTSGAKTIAEAVEILIRRNYGESRLAILEHMGGAAERRTDCSPAEALGREFADFNLLAIECSSSTACFKSRGCTLTPP